MIRGFLASLGATLTRIVLIFAALMLIWDVGVRLVVQVAPASFWFEFTRVIVLPSGKLAIAYRKSRSGDLPINVVVELLGENGFQPCASSGRRLIEADTDFAILPIGRALPGCEWLQVPDGEYRLQMTGSYPAAGAYDKSVTVISDNAIVVKAGRIAGASTARADSD